MQFPDPSEEVQKRASQPLYEFVADGPPQFISPPIGGQTAEVNEGIETQTSQVPEGWAAMQAPPLAPPEALTPAKRSRKWIWIVVAVLGVVLLASCGLCGWASYSMFSSTFKQVIGSMNVIENYYSAIEAKNYTGAYGYLDPQGTISGLTLDKFIQQARRLDNQYGPVLSYTPGTPTFAIGGSGGADLSRLTITVNIRRPKLSYTALLTLSRIGGTWKIVDFDRI
jgi:hypothetical protein